MVGRLIVTAAAGLAGVSACAPGASAPLELGPSPIGVQVYARVHYYDVTAASLAEMRSEITRDGPRIGTRAWTAVTHYRLFPRFEYRAGAVGGCVIDDVKVRVETTITYPRWTPASSPDSSLIAWWNQMDEGLKEHERGHALIAVQSADRIVKIVKDMSGGSCDALSVRANGAAQREYAEMRKRQELYDDETGHGRTQIVAAGRRMRGLP